MSECKLVHSEPTQEMYDAGENAIACSVGQSLPFAQLAGRVYDAMYAAAPSPEWVKCSEGIPSPEDADERHEIWVCNMGAIGDPVVELTCYSEAVWYTHWMAKLCQQPPKPPESSHE